MLFLLFYLLLYQLKGLLWHAARKSVNCTRVSFTCVNSTRGFASKAPVTNLNKRVTFLEQRIKNDVTTKGIFPPLLSLSPRFLIKSQIPSIDNQHTNKTINPRKRMQQKKKKKTNEIPNYLRFFFFLNFFIKSLILILLKVCRI